jgi:hypothetical protein
MLMTVLAEKELERMLDRRLKELKEGREEAIPGKIVFERIRQKMGFKNIKK